MNEASIGLIICGITGRMGKSIAESAASLAKFQVIGATARPGSKWIGANQGEILIQSSVKDAIKSANCANDRQMVIIDFSSPEACIENAKDAAEHGIPLLVGTTGLDESHLKALKTTSEKVAVMVAPNTSLGANLLHALSRIAAKALPTADCEIMEMHHNQKKDCPSGTAIYLGNGILKARQDANGEHITTARQAHARRQTGEVGIFGLRGGNVFGEHTVYFFLENERIELTHKVADRSVFAQGAIKAAEFLAGKTAGFYDILNVLGI